MLERVTTELEFSKVKRVCSSWMLARWVYGGTGSISQESRGLISKTGGNERFLSCSLVQWAVSVQVPSGRPTAEQPSAFAIAPTSRNWDYVSG